MLFPPNTSNDELHGNTYSNGQKNLYDGTGQSKSSIAWVKVTIQHGASLVLPLIDDHQSVNKLDWKVRTLVYG